MSKNYHNEILDALKKNEAGIPLAPSKETVSIADLREEIMKLKVEIADVKVKAYLVGVAAGQDHILEHISGGPCGNGCEIDAVIGALIKPTTYGDFVKFKPTKRRKK